MGRRHKCPYCGSTDTRSKGSRNTKTLGARKIRRCCICRRRFTPKHQREVDVEEVMEPSTEHVAEEQGLVDAGGPTSPGP